tara:strand:- start:36 stop:269 length:234 start_codon:yes stop_codon:yes gene_type:complete
MNKMVNGVVVAMTDAEITARNAQIAEIATEEAANGYKRQRAREYPSIEDQLDDIYHNGIDAWKATIKTTKDKYPKPS